MDIRIVFKTLVGNLLMTWTDWAYQKRLSTIHNKIFSFLGLSTYPIVNNKIYANKYNRLIFERLITNRVGVSYNVKTIGNKKQSIPLTKQLSDIFSYCYTNVVITGNSDVVVDLKKECVINDYCYDIDENVMFIDGLLYRHKHNICILRSNFTHIRNHITEGIMIVGKLSSNYYHDLYENLNRLLLIPESGIPTNVPILVDEIITKVPSFYKVFSYLSESFGREFIVLESNELYCVNKLHVLSHINEIAPHIKDVSVKSTYYWYDPTFLHLMRSTLLQHMSSVSTPKRIFLTRKNTKIRHFNEKEIFQILQEYHFVAIAPENYSFEEQMALFNNAEWIVGCTGSAFSNLIFCKNKCNIICLRSVNVGVEPPVFNTIAEIVGANIQYYTPDLKRSKKSVHSDFYIDPINFRKKVEPLLNYGVN